MKKTAILLAISFFGLAGCRIEKLGKDLSNGFSQGSEAIASNAMTGVQKALRDSAFKQNLYSLVDSLTRSAGANVSEPVRRILDTLTSERVLLLTKRIIEEATGEKLKGNLASLRNELLGAATNDRVRLLVETAVASALNDDTNKRLARLRDEVLGDATNLRLMRIRDSLLGEKTAVALRAVLDSSLGRASRFLETDLRKGIDSNASIIEKYAVRWLLLLAAIAAFIIWLVWRNRQKYAKMVTVLTSQINAIPDQRAYDELTARIKDKAIETGVEPNLRKVLQENGLMGKENWEAGQLKRSALAQSKN